MLRGRGKQEIVESLPAPTVRDNLFASQTPYMSKKDSLSLYRRQVEAMGHTFQRGVEAFVARDSDGNAIELEHGYALDDAFDGLTQSKLVNANCGFLPIPQLEWYANQGFIGWQIAAMLSQNWLIDKACGVPAKDAVRNGYEVLLNDGSELDPKVANAIRLADKAMNIKGKTRVFLKKGRIFGIRHALFLINGIDYEAPFNADGITPGSYRGIAQIDPYWIAPELDAAAAANPASVEFYEPTWWRVNGKRVHRSHFIITRTDDLPDILKPSYLYGGIPIPQKIYNRVFAAERTADEAPMLAMSKRLMTLQTDTTKWFGPDATAAQGVQEWAALTSNWGIRVVGTDDTVQQFETNLTGLDETIMTQYQLVAAAANVPATKLLGTSPKGFNATGEYEESVYHEELESIQENDASPFVERHHICLMRSHIIPKFGLDPKTQTEIKWRSTDSMTAKEEAETNEIKSRTAKNYADSGAIDGLDIRRQLISDHDSDFTGIEEIVEGGPGDREAEQEAKQAMLDKPAPGEGEAQDAAMKFDPTHGTLDGAKLVTHQKFLDDAIVQQKLENADFEVFVTPEFTIDGKQYRMIMDGHHSLAAAMRARIHPFFTVKIPKPEVFNAVTREVMDSLDRELEKANNRKRK